MTPASVDIAFSKYKEKGRRTIDFDRFQDAVACLALSKFAGLPEDAAFEAACAQILAAGGPALVGASKPRTDGICESYESLEHISHMSLTSSPSVTGMLCSTLLLAPSALS